MNKKVFILFFISKEDTVIRSVIAICHDPHKELLFFFSKNVKMLFFLSSHTGSWKALPFILYFPFFSMMFAKGHVYATHAEIPISMVMWGALLRFSQRDCHSYNSGNPIGPEHQCIPPACITPHVSHPQSRCVWVCVCEREKVLCA